MNLLKMDWDNIEQLIEKALNDRIRTYDSYKYMIIDESHLIVKVYEDNQLVFTIKFLVTANGLEVNEVW